MTYRAPKVDVDDYTEERWDDIERSVFAKLDGEEALASNRRVVQGAEALPAERALRWRPAVAFVIAGAAAAAIGGLVFHSMSPGVSMTAAPSRITTAGSESHVTLGEAALDVGPNSAVLVSGDDEHGILVILDKGRVDCAVAPRKGRPPFVVTAGDVRVVVVGTRFTVTHPDGSTRVDVREGVVEVTSHGETASVHAGETWPSSAAAPAKSAAELPTTDGQEAVPAASEKREPGPPVRPASGARPPAAASLGSRDFPEPSDEEPYEAAAKKEKSDPDAALATYRKIASGTGPWAPNALFAAGRLEADRGHRAEATRLLNAYLTRFPRGPNAVDARALIDRMH